MSILFSFKDNKSITDLELFNSLNELNSYYNEIGNLRSSYLVLYST